MKHLASPRDGPSTANPIVAVSGLSKRYEIFERPHDRLKQFLVPRLQTLLLPARLRRAQPFYKEFWALREVSFALGRGEALGVLGRNGAGKSTLLQIIAGTLAPTAGTILVNGRVAALLELGSGFSAEFTGAENVRLNAALLGLTPEDIDSKYDEIAAFADIGDFIDQPVKTYSTGMMLRLAFAVQTAVEPELLVVDEALAVGDARFQKKCFGRLERLKERGTTVMFVTHDTGAILQFCSRAIILDGGRIVDEGDPHRVSRHYHRLLFDVPSPVADEDEASALIEHSDLDGRTELQDAPVNARAAPPSIAASREFVRELRYGSKEAEIVEIGLRDAGGAETRAIEIHTDCQLYLRVRFNKDIDNLVAYGFAISDARGVEVFGTKSQLFRRRLPPSPAGSMFECVLRARLPFIPGPYFLTAALAHDDDRPAGEFLDYRFDAMQFQLFGNPRCFTTCIVDLNGTCDHKALLTPELER